MPEYCNLELGQFKGEGHYDIPIIEPVYELPIRRWIAFSAVRSRTHENKNVGMHFFLDDRRFERVWNSPNKYLSFLDKFGCVLSPDYSLYTNMPKAVQIFNHYRKHWLAAYWQSLGYTVIPTIAWSDEESFEWCFDGEPKNSIVAVSNLGCCRTGSARQLFMLGYNEMLKRLQPKEVLFYAKSFYENQYPGNIRRIVHSLEYAEEVQNDLGRT